MAGQDDLSAAQAALAVEAIRERARAADRPLTRREGATVVALMAIVRAHIGHVQAAPRSSKRPAREAWRTSPVPFAPGTPVVFQTAGRSGNSPPRKGVVTGFRRSPRGVWLEIAEEGAAPGVVVRTRRGLMQVCNQSEDLVNLTT